MRHTKSPSLEVSLVQTLQDAFLLHPARDAYFAQTSGFCEGLQEVLPQKSHFVLHEDDGTITSGVSRNNDSDTYDRGAEPHYVTQGYQLKRCSPDTLESCTTQLVSLRESGESASSPWMLSFSFVRKDEQSIKLSLLNNGARRGVDLNLAHWEGVTSFSRGGHDALIEFVVQQAQSDSALDVVVRYSHRPIKFAASEILLTCIDDVYETFHCFHDACFRAFAPPDFFSEFSSGANSLGLEVISKDRFSPNSPLTTGSFSLNFMNAVGDLAVRLKIELSQEPQNVRGNQHPVVVDSIRCE
ncbi:MAG: hypothetical protein KDD60_00855, partial [Bdellovibrionales bacterium]|nr:hypothetical protein [Bdellovibrionales bacterium]